MSFLDTLKSSLLPDTPAKIEKLRNKLPLEFPAELANPLMDYMLERSYLEDLSDRDRFVKEEPHTGAMAWIKIDRLPVHPNDSAEYDLMSRWQAVLSSLHSWNERVLFLLQRRKGATSIYLGMQAPEMDKSLARLETALVNSMPGITTSRLGIEESLIAIGDLLGAKSCGAITGIPSFRRESKFQELQTLDSLAFGIRDAEGRDADFSLLVVADPISDQSTTDIISRMMKLGTEIHKDVHKTYSQSVGISKGGASMGLGVLIGTIAEMIPLGKIALPFLRHGFSSNGMPDVQKPPISLTSSQSTLKSPSTNTVSAFARGATLGSGTPEYTYSATLSTTWALCSVCSVLFTQATKAIWSLSAYTGSSLSPERLTY